MKHLIRQERLQLAQLPNQIPSQWEQSLSATTGCNQWFTMYIQDNNNLWLCFRVYGLKGKRVAGPTKMNPTPDRKSPATMSHLGFCVSIITMSYKLYTPWQVCTPSEISLIKNVHTRQAPTPGYNIRTHALHFMGRYFYIPCVGKNCDLLHYGNQYNIPGA